MVRLAALEIATVEVMTRTSARRRAIELLDFLNLLVRTYPRRQLHLVLDNVSTQSPTSAAPAARRHPEGPS